MASKRPMDRATLFRYLKVAIRVTFPLLMGVKDGPYRCQGQVSFMQIRLSVKFRRKLEEGSSLYGEDGDQQAGYWVICQFHCQVLFSAAGVLFFIRFRFLVQDFADGCIGYRPSPKTG